MFHNILKTHNNGLHMAPMPADDIAAIANDLVVYVPDENCRNPSKEARHQQDLGAQAGQDRI